MSGLSQGRAESAVDEAQCERLWPVPDEVLPLAAHADTLLRTVETEIIPRLMLLHRQGVASSDFASASNDRVSLGDEEVEAFTTLILKGHDEALGYVKELVALGARLESLCLHLLAPAARRLGELWNADLCNFTDVTIALGRLQAMLRGLGNSIPLHPAAANGYSALFAPVPGEQHTFGLTMVCDFFRTAGWCVWGESPPQAEAVLKLVRDHRFDIVGFAIGSDRSIDTLASLIRSVKKHSKNRVVRVLAGGPLLLERPEIVALVGADATAPDARQAILAATTLVATRDEGR